MERFFEKVVMIPEAGCHIWMAQTFKGYGIFKVDGKNRKAHRVAWELKNGPIPDGLQVRHRCHIQCCVNQHHLELGTQQDNEDDKTALMRQAHTLTVEQVLAIRSDIRSTRTIAKDYEISHQTVGDIKRRKWWRHI